MIQAWQDWYDNVDEAMEEAGTSSDMFTKHIQNDTEDISNATEELADTIDE
jgi:hypothetical protein